MRELLHILPRPSRYIGIEEGSVHKDIAKTELHMALAFPDTYEVGMSYLGLKILYSICNAQPEWWAERVFAPCRDAGAVLRTHKAPLCSLESDTPLRNMHLLGFSITHELCYTNVLYMLDLAGIPLRSDQRGNDLFIYPVIVAGGGAMLSAEPLAPFIDICILGDGEQTLVDLCMLLVQARRNKLSRKQFLLEARHIAGIYVPSLFADNGCATPTPLYADYTSASRRIVPDIDAIRYPEKQVVPIGAVHNRLALEIARGCTRGCRFCHAGIVYRPVRERSISQLQTLLDNCLDQTGFDEVSYLSLSTGDFSALKHFFTATVDRCSAEQISVSLPSLRVGSIDDSIMKKMAGIRRTGATLAPEAGSQRLRDVINKGVTEEELLLHVQKLVEHGWQQVKLYFMIGLPTETTEDLDAIVTLCQKVRDCAGKNAPRLQVTAAISPFVPKPFTPFQWEAQIDLSTIQERIHYLREQFKGIKCCKMRWHEPTMSHLEGILSRGDRRLADVVEKAYTNGGIFASWVEGFSLQPWEDALAACGLTAQDFFCARDVDAALPWDHLEAGVSKDFLRREYKRALQAKVTDDCRYANCHMCGACDTKTMPSRLPRLTPTTIYANRLNFPQRDQTAHTPRLDAQGDILRPKTRPAPPKISPELIVKAVTYRVWHSRMYLASFLSQLELQAILERAMRRAALPMAFSQGFHPLPLLSFGRALPVGVSSYAEWFAITLRKPVDAQTVAQRLAMHLPPYMDILCVTPVTDKVQRTEQACAESFCLTIQGTKKQQQACINAWKMFDTAAQMLHTRDTKKGQRTVDIRALVQQVSVIDSKTVCFTTDWKIGYLSPQTLVQAVCGVDDTSGFTLTKTAQFFADGSVYPPNKA